MYLDVLFAMFYCPLNVGDFFFFFLLHLFCRGNWFHIVSLAARHFPLWRRQASRPLNFPGETIWGRIDGRPQPGNPQIKSVYSEWWVYASVNAVGKLQLLTRMPMVVRVFYQYESPQSAPTFLRKQLVLPDVLSTKSSTSDIVNWTSMRLHIKLAS